MDSDGIKEDLEILIKELMVKEGVGEYDLHFEGKTEAGDNYAAEIHFLKVVPKDGKETYNLVAKTAKRNLEQAKFLPFHLFYDRELYVYSKMFPTFRQLIEDTNSGLKFDFVPKIYSICDDQWKQTLILENLKTKGFKLHDRKKPWSLEHSLLSMESYGKFHALSLALGALKPEIYKEMSKQMPDLTKEFGKEMDVKVIYRPVLGAIIENLKKNGRDDLVKKYDGLIDEIEVICDHELEPESDKIVLAHADCWNNNFMFKYQDEDDSKPTSICILDFQICLPRSPVKDLSYHIYTTCDKSTLDQLDLLLKTYHASLSKTLRKLGCEPDNVFSYKQLMEHWKKYGKYGIATAPFILKMCLVDKENVVDFAEMSRKSENIQEFSEGFNVKLNNTDEYDRRMLDVFVHYGDNFL